MDRDVIILASLTAAVALGIGMSTAAITCTILYSSASARLAERLNSFRPQEPRMQKIKKQKWSPFRDKKTMMACLLGAVAFGLLTIGTPYLPVAMSLGSLAGMAGVLITRHLRESSGRFYRLREVAILYESIDLFTQAGFTVRQAIQMSLPLVPGLRPVLEKCIERWGGGSVKAIEQLGRDIDLPEADVLISVLMHAEEVGTGRVSGVMEEEASRIDELRQTLAEMRVAGKPLYATVYIFLPVATLLGMIMAPLTYRTITMLSNMRAPGGI